MSEHAGKIEGGAERSRLPSPTRTIAVGPGDAVRTATVADGDELCVSNRSGGPIGVFVEPDPAMLGDWAEALIRENDALAARVDELERERDAIIGLCYHDNDGWFRLMIDPLDGDEIDYDTKHEVEAAVRRAAGLGEAKGEVE